MVLEDPKQLENISSAAFNDISSEQSCTVIEIKEEGFNMKPDTKKNLSKAKWSMRNIEVVICQSQTY